MSSHKSQKNLDLMQTFETYINESRQSFAQQMTTDNNISIESAIKYTDELCMRVEYYK